MIFGADSIEYGHELHKLSEVLFKAGKLCEAVTMATRAEEIFRAHYGESHELVTEVREYLRKLRLISS